MKSIVVLVLVFNILNIGIAQEPGSGFSLNFNDSNGYVQLSKKLSIGCSSHTIEFWVKVPEPKKHGSGGSVGGGSLIGNYSSTHDYHLEILDNGEISIFWNDEQVLTGNTDLRDGTWHHLAFVRDTVSNSFITYIDGEFEKKTDSSGENIVFTSKPTIGGNCDDTYPAPLFKGMIDEVRIWGIAKTQDEIRGNMCEKISTSKKSNLISYYNFDENNDTTIIDIASYKNSGKLIGHVVREVSGAPVGDESIFIDSAIIGSSLNLTHINNDIFTINITKGKSDALFLYRVDGKPNSTATSTIDLLSQVDYFGVHIIKASELEYNITYNYDGHPGIINEDSLVLYSRKNNSTFNWVKKQDATLNTVDNTLKWIGAQSSEYILGSTAINNLPIELLSFTVRRLNGTVEVEWKTLTEINNDYFELQRSEDGINWDVFAVRNGAGNSNAILKYSVVDDNPYNGISYYRLKQVDFDGNFTYSKINVVNTEKFNLPQVVMYPNPAINQIVIENFQQEIHDIRIYNHLGQDVTSFIDINRQNNAKVEIKLSRLSSGMYIVKVNSESYKIYKK